ncbi:hypothetical protein BpHYR1_003430 [Brachionus plicatilis]|uniref:Uncharacterized protein n=1 Tax=Brachionus plicatilis TaxID=10195 RepID=A0A3M7QNG0_BRAPC|nr:hypothetical protein BpHYR1_003430 [Brachionus plicatilis]
MRKIKKAKFLHPIWGSNSGITSAGDIIRSCVWTFWIQLTKRNPKISNSEKSIVGVHGNVANTTKKKGAKSGSGITFDRMVAFANQEYIWNQLVKMKQKNILKGESGVTGGLQRVGYKEWFKGCSGRWEHGTGLVLFFRSSHWDALSKKVLCWWGQKWTKGCHFVEQLFECQKGMKEGWKSKSGYRFGMCSVRRIQKCTKSPKNTIFLEKKVVMEQKWKKVQRCESSFLIGYPTRHQPSLCDVRGCGKNSGVQIDTESRP